jgi:N-methylhydantoinase A/oxoprolinase/acetone carboxylase beta subunit
LLERENAAILNESLKPLCKETIEGFQKALTQDVGLDCPFYLTQNDGTLIR